MKRDSQVTNQTAPNTPPPLAAMACTEESTAAWVAEQRREDLLHAGRRAIETLEATLESARRQLARAEAGPCEEILSLPGQLLATVNWGAANASAELTCLGAVVATCAVAQDTLNRLRQR
jgi:hypothetical protein